MAMQVSGNYVQSRIDYAEKVKEKQAAEKAEKAKEVQEAEKGAGEKGAGRLSEPQDVYIHGEKSEKEPAGLYRIGKDEDGSRKIFFDDPAKADRADNKEEPKADEDGKKPKVDGNGQGKPTEKCVADTDKVDREIKKLKEKKQQLEQQIQSASGDEKKIRELEKKLAQVENELRQKNNDTYRKQHSEFSQMK